MKVTKRDRVRAQVKSRFYYAFWGAATVAVVSGQLYVGTSYRAMAKSMNRWFEETMILYKCHIKEDQDLLLQMVGIFLFQLQKIME